MQETVKARKSFQNPVHIWLLIYRDLFSGLCDLIIIKLMLDYFHCLVLFLQVAGVATAYCRQDFRLCRFEWQFTQGLDVWCRVNFNPTRLSLFFVFYNPIKLKYYFTHSRYRQISQHNMAGMLKQMGSESTQDWQQNSKLVVTFQFVY